MRCVSVSVIMQTSPLLNIAQPWQFFPSIISRRNWYFRHCIRCPKYVFFFIILLYWTVRGHPCFSFFCSPQYLESSAIQSHLKGFRFVDGTHIQFPVLHTIKKHWPNIAFKKSHPEVKTEDCTINCQHTRFQSNIMDSEVHIKLDCLS